MINRTTKLRWRRRLRNQRKQVEGMGSQAEEHLERHFFKRLGKLSNIRRFVFAWVTLILVLIFAGILQIRTIGNYYLTLKPVPGGTYTEGILGDFTNANPIYATGNADSSVSRLIFASLLKYDSHNRLTGDLASSWTADAKALNYTVKLKPNLVWQDGQPLTSDDVVFTYQLIQNPDAQSPLGPSWAGVTVHAEGPRTVVFTLPDQLSSFPYSLTNGIVPKHLLSSIPVGQLRSTNFNTINAIGAGPFKMSAVEVYGDKPENREQRVALTPFTHYYAGSPKLNKFIVRAFHDQKQLERSFKNDELNGVAGLQAIPADWRKNQDIQSYNLPLTSEVMVFFKMTQPILKDANVRQALAAATNRVVIINNLGYPVIPANEPLLKSDNGYNSGLTEQGYNIKLARTLLERSGWKMTSSGIRSKNGQLLSLNLYSQTSDEYSTVTSELQRQWKAVGVKVNVVLEQQNDLQNTIASHDYDVLLYGISVGTDPDVFAYWHSSQINSLDRLNLSEYSEPQSDSALEAGRTRLDPKIRAIKYRAFLQAWRQDVPAIAIYQPRYLYLTNGYLFGLSEHSINTSADRFNNVVNWMVRQQPSSS